MSGVERKATDSEEWRPLKISTERSVITEGGRQTTSFFFSSYRRIKTLINSQVQGSWTSPFLCQSLGGEGVFLNPLVHSSQRGRRRHPSRGILGNLAWPETWRR